LEEQGSVMLSSLVENANLGKGSRKVLCRASTAAAEVLDEMGKEADQKDSRRCRLGVGPSKIILCRGRTSGEMKGKLRAEKTGRGRGLRKINAEKKVTRILGTRREEQTRFHEGEPGEK